MHPSMLARFALIVTLALSAAAFAATPAAEKAFVDTYKKALESSDKKALQGLLYTENAHPMALDFYMEMLAMEAGAKVIDITLTDLTAEDKQKLASEKGPDGKPMKTNVPVVKKLSVKTERKSDGGSMSGTSSLFVGEVKGKLVIAVPAK